MNPNQLLKRSRSVLSSRRITLPDPDLYPATEGIPLRPRWYVRLRGLLSLGVVVVGGGIAVAVVAAIVLALAIIAALSYLA